MIRARVHPFPSRTRKLSSLLPTILGWRRPGKIGNANTREGQSEDCSFSCYAPTKEKEGRVFWIPRAELEKYKLPVSFDQTLRLFEEEELMEHYCHWDGSVYRRELL